MIAKLNHPAIHSKSRDKDAAMAEALAFAYGEEEGVELEPSEAAPPPRTTPPPAPSGAWHPDLNPTQKLIFDDMADHVLGYGEKGSGKSIGFGHKVVRHAYENDNALVLIIAPSIRVGNEGIWHDLDTLILPQWKDGIGLEFSAPKLDPSTKDRHRWIRNRFGGWSKLLLVAVQYGVQVQNRVKGPAPSMVYVDELTNCDSREYWTYPAAQLNRRRGTVGPQQFCASCNPSGQSHWVYQVFFVECLDEKGVRDPDFSVHHVPMSENRHRPGMEKYEAALIKILKRDPIEHRRLISGEWVDRPTGEGLFKEYYIEAIHKKGDVIKGHGLKPIVGFPIIIGYDLGQVFSSVTFMQLIPAADKNTWIIFDEVDHLGEKILYKKLAWEAIARMRFWRKLMDYNFAFMHVTDESAINQWRPGGGSYDAWDFEREYNSVAADLGSRKMKMLGCPKGPGSVSARVRMLQGKLYQEEIAVSALCKNTLEMLTFLEADKEDPEKPKRSRYLHKFDSLSYAMFKLDMQGGVKTAIRAGSMTPSLIHCGAN